MSHSIIINSFSCVLVFCSR